MSCPVFLCLNASQTPITLVSYMSLGGCTQYCTVYLVTDCLTMLSLEYARSAEENDVS